MLRIHPQNMYISDLYELQIAVILSNIPCVVKGLVYAKFRVNRSVVLGEFITGNKEW